MKKKEITSNPPKRTQVIQEIIRNIENGTLKNGERLASVRKLSDFFNVSISVVQNAMRVLADDGFVECRGASGFYVCAPEKDEPENEIQKNTDDKIFLSSVHHSDLVWQYTYKEYARIREEQLLWMIKLSEKYPQFHFGVEQAQIMTDFLEEHPELHEYLKKLHKENRFETLGGLCIPDLNLISGESIAQNMVAGRNVYRKLFGAAPEICCMNDAFGMCAQLPQILAKCGYKYLLPGRKPNIPPALAAAEQPFYWSGMDDSKILFVHGIMDVTHLGYSCNVPVIRNYESQLTYSMAALKERKGNVLAHYMLELGNVMEEMFWVIEMINRSPGKRIEFGSHADYLKQIEGNSFPVYQGEFNPTFSGCYTTRISVKQRNRKAENLLTAAEMFDVFSGKPVDRSGLWHELIMTQFHDGICGCHHDRQNKEIAEKQNFVIDTAQKCFRDSGKEKITFAAFGTGTGKQLIRSEFVPEGVEAQKDGTFHYYLLDLPNCGTRQFRRSTKPAAEGKPCSAVFQTDFYDVDFSTSFPVIRNRNGENVFSGNHFGEILFRIDYGTMWVEKFMSTNFGHDQQKESVVSVEEGPVFFKVTTEGHVLDQAPKCGNQGNHWPGFKSLKFKKEYLFPKHHDTFRLKVTLDWKGNNTMISIKFPLNLKAKDASATYEIPFGSIVRQPYFEVEEEFESSLKSLNNQRDYIQAKGNWPALNWVNYSDLQKGVTIANTGTPGHQLVNNSILITLLRSGTEVLDGNMVPQEGSFENGVHEFEFAICAHAPREMEKAAMTGRQLNAPPQICSEDLPEGEFLAWEKENVILSAIRHTDDGILFRLYETLGRQTKVSLAGKLLETGTLFETDMEGNLLEEIDPETSFRPFEIKTFIIRKTNQ